MRHWILQGNPKRFDLDRALQELEYIDWRTPQYSGDAHAGDRVVLWRSGSDAGVVGFGVVAAEPALRPSRPEERPYTDSESGEGQVTTRAPIRVVPCEFLAKPDFAELAGLNDHQIVRAPMGTVFTLEADEFAAVHNAVGSPALPVVDGAASPRFPEPLAWEHRRRDVYPLPGGYDGYFDSPQRSLNASAERRFTTTEFLSFLRDAIGASASNAKYIASFLRAAGFVVIDSERVYLTSVGEAIRTTGDEMLTIANLHSRCRFVGEMLAALAQAPMSADELLDYANIRFDAG